MPPTSLRDAFELVVTPYEEDASGKTLAQLLADDWHLFPSEKMDEAHVKELLAEIFDDGELVRKRFSPTRNPDTSLQQWDSLRSEIMHANRWFLKGTLDIAQLREHLDALIVSPHSLSNIWFRARLMTGTTPFSPAEMGPPPSHLAAHGRANPAGIPYLYLGSHPDTAVSEVRPHTGESATIASFTLSDAQFVDLRTPRASVSPFILDDEAKVVELQSYLPLLEKLGEELTRPVIPRSAPFEYIPSQYLCEYIKSCGFDGVVYRSSVSDGVNVAIFDPAMANIADVYEARVERVTVSVIAA